MRGVTLGLLLGLACVAAVGAQDSSNTDSNAIVKLANIIADSEMKPAPPVQHSLLAKATLEFWPAFLASIAVIVISELGDKTFFIAAIMAMRHNRVSVFLGAIAALGVMTILSAAMGYALPSILPREYTHFASIVLFLFFGVKLLKDAYGMSADEPNEELDEVESELDKKEIELGSVEMEGGHREEKIRPVKVTWKNLFSPIFVQCFTMTFLAEWGDRSQISTIAMAAVKNPYGVTIGGILGHALCTGLAVLGGKLVATKISEKTVATLGGFLFLFFALHGMYTGPSSE